MANLISGNVGVRAVTAVNYSGTASGSVNSDATGVYSIPALTSGTYQIQPVLAGWQFIPPVSPQQIIVSSNITGLNFMATAVKINGVWSKQNVVLPPNSADNTGTNLLGISNPTIMYEGGAQILSGTVFKQWYCAASQKVGYAESTDCILWTRFNTDGYLFSGAANTASVIRVYHDVLGGTGYYMYGGVSPWTTLKCWTSPDGVIWTLANAALMTVGGAGKWDHGSIPYFNIIDQVAGTWRALYSADNGSSVTGAGVATGSSLTGAFTNATSAAIPGIGGVGTVIKVSGTYYSWGGDASNAPTLPYTRLCRSSSADGLTWTAIADTQTALWKAEDTSNGAITVPSMVEASGSVYCVYTGNDHEDTGADYQSFLSIAPMTMAQLVGTTEITAAGELVSDNFVRANETPLSQGGNWTTYTGAVGGVNLASNLAIPSANSGDTYSYYSGITWPANQYCEITLNAIQAGGEVRAVCRTDFNGASETGYLAQCLGVGASSGIKLFKVVAGSFTQLGTTQTVTTAAGDVIRCTADGTTITLSRNGTILISVTDSSIASGRAAVVLAANGTAANTSVTRWAGGIPGFTISGALGAGGAGATVTYTGASFGTVTADGSGNYSIPGLASGAYTIIPSLAGSSFSPSNSSQTVAGANKTSVNFTTTSGSSGGLSVPYFGNTVD